MQFRRALQRARLAHAFLLAGPPGVGKRTFARNLAQSLLCKGIPDKEFDACQTCANCKRFTAGTHPDFYEIACPEGKKSIPIELFVGDEDHRGRAGLCYELSLKPMSSDWKIAIIDDAHLTQHEAANSLLKTLEEPPESSLIIMITDREEAILPTIRSRVQTVRFSPLSDRDLDELVHQLGLTGTAHESERLVALADGSLSIAQQMTEEGTVALAAIVRGSYPQLHRNSLKMRSELYDWIESAGDSSQQRNAATKLLRYLGNYFRAQLRDASGETAQVDLQTLQIERLREAEQQLYEMMPLNLWCEGLVDDLAGFQRGESRKAVKR
jgi:DNA polymerase-3 subunit delta'